MSKKTNYDYEQEKEIWLCMSQAVIHVYHVGKKAEMFVIFCEEKEIKTLYNNQTYLRLSLDKRRKQAH